MQLVIEKMLIENFKGTKHQEISFGDRTAIYARNGLGKTTIADAFYWVLFNKDSAGNAPGSDNFREKPLDSTGEEIHNLETDVILSCRLDGAPFVLRRMQKENWVKKRGSSNPTFQGNVSTYWINGVETGANDFRKRISAIADEDTFPMIATMSAFNAADWKKRRSILLSMSAIDVDASLWERDEYQPLADECNSRGVHVEDIRKVLQDQLRGLRRDAEMLPVRIDEASRSIPDLSEKEIRDAEYMVKERGETIAKLDQMIAAERAGISGADGTLARLTSVNQQMLSMQDASRAERALERDKITREIRMREDTAEQYDGRLSRIRDDVERSQKNKTSLEAQREKLRAQYSSVYSEKFTDTVSETCPTCGQALPLDQVAAAKEAARSAWLEQKRARLEQIKRNGADLNMRIDTEAQYQESMTVECDHIEADSTENGKILAGLRESLAALNQQPLSYLTDPHYLELQKEADSLAAGRKENPDDRIRKIEAERAVAKQSYDKFSAVLARRDQGIEAKKRVELLQAEHQQVGEKIALVEKMMILAEKFITDRCGLLEESINQLFPTLRWKLFNVQINGGITDTCVCMIPCRDAPVPYSSANTASKLYADIEIINVLSEVYDTELPLFFDNRERVNVVPRTKGQIITLSVSDDEEMRVEIN